MDRCIRFWNTQTQTPLQCVDTSSQARPAPPRPALPALPASLPPSLLLHFFPPLRRGLAP